MNFKNKLILIISSIIFIFGGFAVLFTYFQSSQVMKDVIINNLNENAYLASSQIAESINRSKILANIVARQIENEYGSDVNNFISEKDNILKLLETNNFNNNYSAIYIMNLEGDTIISTDPAFIGENYSFRPYFSEAILGKSYLYMAVGVTSKKPGYYFSEPIKDKDGFVKGVLAMKARPEIINKFAITPRYKDSVSMFTDKDGIILYSSNVDLIFRTLSELSRVDVSRLKAEKRFEGIIFDPLKYSQAAKIIRYYEGVESYEFNNPINNKDEIITVSKVSDADYYLIYKNDSDTVFFQADYLSGIMALMVLLSAILANLIIIFNINFFILDPLDDLNEGIDIINNGDLNYRFIENKQSGLNNFVNKINHLLDSLQININDIKKREDLKTKEVDRFNKFMAGRELKMIELKKELDSLTKVENKNNKNEN